MPLKLMCLVLIAFAASVAAAQTPERRKPVPAPALEAATQLVAEVYKKELEAAKTQAQQRALARKIFEESRKPTDDWASRYALLTAASKLATQSGDAELICEIIDARAVDFDEKALQTKVGALEMLAPNIKLDIDHYFFTRMADEMLTQLIKGHEYDVAARLARLAETSARKLRDTDLAKVYAAQAVDLTQQVDSYLAAREAQTRLDLSPTSAEANETAGKLLCFELEDWSRGVPMLALGADQEAQACAELELRASTNAEKLQLADTWSKLAQSQTGLAQRNTQRHALGLYQQVQPSLSGLSRTRVDKQVSELFLASMPDRIPLSMFKPIRYDVFSPHLGPFMVGEVAGRHYPGSIWSHAPQSNGAAIIEFDLPCEFKYLVGKCAFHTRIKPQTPVVFRANGNGGQELFRIKERLATIDTLVPFRIDLRGQKRLGLIVDCPGSHHESWAIWVSPMLQK